VVISTEPVLERSCAIALGGIWGNMACMIYGGQSRFANEKERLDTSTIAGVTGRPLDAVVRGSERVEVPPASPTASPGPAK